MIATGSAEAGIAATYRLLSLAFAVPDEQTVEELRRLTVFAARHAEDDQLAGLLADLEHTVDDDELVTALQDEYWALFRGAVRCSPHEAGYRDDGAPEPADLADLYREAEAEPTALASERSDHAGCELEFLALLVARRARAEEEGDAASAEADRRVEDAFLRDHLGRWFAAFCREVAGAAELPAYRLVALAGGRFLAVELARRGIAGLRPLSSAR